MVPKAGLEPARISTVDFESTASTDFATSALEVVCGKRGHYTFPTASRNTYQAFNRLNVEKNVTRRFSRLTLLISHSKLTSSATAIAPPPNPLL
jgi:hypothetical protein